MQLIKDQTPLTFFSDSQGQQQFLKSSQHLTTLKNTEIKDVYRENFQEEMLKMMKLAQTYNYISMDTQFPGVNIANQYVPWTTNDQAEHEYHVIKQNVDNSKIIQIGLTLSDQNGRVPQGVCTWQFNFEFILGFDIIQKDSKQLLTNAGIIFERLKTNGIKLKDFAEYMVSSGIVLNNRMKWIVFHGSYDFAYLLKMVHGDGLPDTTEQFYKLMRMYYPNIYDLKYYIKDLPNLKDVGLAKLGNEIGCSRIGPQHQAGSDSLLTLCCFFKLKQKKQTDAILKNNNYLNIIYGIGKGYVKSNLNNVSNNYIEQRMWQNDQQQQQQYMQMSHQYYYSHHQQVYYYYPHVYNMYDNGNGNRI